MVVIAHVTQAQAATIINAALTFIQYTFGLAIVVVLVYFMYNINSAIAWSGVTRTLHSSIWPILLRSDSTSSGGSWTRISLLSYLSIVCGILVALAGIITPLGLNDGPYVPTDYASMGATYIEDLSPIGRATSPSEGFAFGRVCGAFQPIPCPGNELNTTDISPRTIEIFSSTPYGPFDMRFRRYYHATRRNYSMSEAITGTLQSLVLRNDIFAVEGLIVDLTKTPGVGLRNHTVPALQRGGVWSEDVLWIEPVSVCVNTNLTVDYRQKARYTMDFASDYNLTDRGGFVNIPQDYPRVSRDGQHVNLYEHAYKAAALSNRYVMRSYNNMTRNESYIGNTFPSKSSSIKIGRMQALSLSAFVNPNATQAVDPALYNATSTLDMLCRGFAGGDTANISNIAMDCTLMLGPPYRADGGDPRLPGDNTTWTQTLHTCVATTRARMQRVEFSFNGTSNIDNLRINRQNTNTSVLWAVENTNMTLANVELFWGRVADSYENDPSLSTIRSELFYLPGLYWAGASDGNPSTVPAALLSSTLADLTLLDGTDYSAISNYALLVKWQTLIKDDPVNSPTQILNMIWTDMMANNLVGTRSATTLNVAPYAPSVDYDYRYGIPALLLVCIWLPLFLVASFILLSRGLRISYLRHLLNQTSIGRVLTGDSSIRASPLEPAGDLVGNNRSQRFRRFEMGSSHLNTKEWTKMAGQTPVAFGPADLVVESMSPATPTSKAEDAEDQPATPHDLFRKKRTLNTSLREYVQSGRSYLAVHPESPETERVE